VFLSTLQASTKRKLTQAKADAAAAEARCDELDGKLKVATARLAAATEEKKSGYAGRYHYKGV
jgi:hypothetical protein